MDEAFLLTVETLSLNRETVTGVPVRGVVALKARAADGYLVVNEAQQEVLDAFRTPQTVPQMLGTAILKRTCLELREFYELALKAHRVGVLTSGASVSAKVQTARRWIPIPWIATVILAAMAFAGLTLAMVLHEPLRPERAMDFLLAWFAWSVALSTGYALASSTLKGAGGDLLRPQWHWVSLVPHFSVDLRDICMWNFPVRVAVSLGQIAPLAAVAALGLAWHQAWVVGPLLGLLVAGNPWQGPVAELRILFGGNLPLDTDRNFLFSKNRSPRRQIRAFFHGVGWRSDVWGIVFGLLWVVVVVWLVYGILQVPLWGALTNMQNLLWLGLSLGIGLSLVIIGFLVWCASVFAMRRGWRLMARLRRQIGRWRNTDAPVLDQAQLLKAMGQSALFRSLGMPQQVEIAKKFEVSTCSAWRTLIPFDQEPARVGLILKGSATVFRRGANGRVHPVQRLREGDIFGAHNLVNRERTNVEIRTRTPVVALTLPVPVFAEQVVAQLGADRSHCLVETCSFLRSSSLCQGWQLSSVMRMADIAQTKTYRPGDKIVARGEDPHSFFVIWEGVVRVERNGRVVGHMEAGDFFGEAELLQNSATEADVIALEAARCLCVPRAEFVRFVTHNYHVALSLERIASERLGHAVFPLQASFEVR